MVSGCAEKPVAKTMVVIKNDTWNGNVFLDEVGRTDVYLTNDSYVASIRSDKGDSVYIGFENDPEGKIVNVDAARHFDLIANKTGTYHLQVK